MGCVQCASGSCGSANSVDLGTKKAMGCGKMESFDWLSDMSFGFPEYPIIEVKFKGGRKEFFKNTQNLDLTTGDFVVCEMPSGYHIGTISLRGELVRLKTRKKGITEDSDLPSIQRIASEKDLEKHKLAIERDLPTMFRTREICKEINLKMKVSDVEFQSDNSKAIFYYTADERVDFRELIKILAAEFKIRIEMKQISPRQEAARLGGVGSSGREICCSTWLTDFKSIPTVAARYQNLSLNSAKLTGQCGRLKCCLNFELETYIDALRGIPTVDSPLKTEKGDAYLQKTDIFRKRMWFSYPRETNWHMLTCDQVEIIQKMNAEGKRPESLTDLFEKAPELSHSVENSDLEILDKKYANKKKKSSGRKVKRFRSEPKNKREDSVSVEPKNKDEKPKNQPRSGNQENKQKSRRGFRNNKSQKSGGNKKE